MPEAWDARAPTTSNELFAFFRVELFYSCAMLLEQVPDVIPLTTQEKSRFLELECTVETHLESFLAAGRALAEICNKRLYRENFITFEEYVQTRWGLHRSRADELIRSFTCAELLLATSGAKR